MSPLPPNNPNCQSVDSTFYDKITLPPISDAAEKLVEKMPMAKIPDSGADVEVSAGCGIVWAQVGGRGH